MENEAAGIAVDKNFIKNKRLITIPATLPAGLSCLDKNHGYTKTPRLLTGRSVAGVFKHKKIPAGWRGFHLVMDSWELLHFVHHNILNGAGVFAQLVHS